jgi:hypothetical protein
VLFLILKIICKEGVGRVISNAGFVMNLKALIIYVLLALQLI